MERSHICRCHFFLSYRWELTVPGPLLQNVFLKNWNTFDPQNFKNTCLIFFMILNDHSILWKMGNTGQLKGLNYNTVLQLDQFCRKQEKWLEVPYIYIYCSLSLCKTCQTYVLRVQILVWNLQLPPVLLLCPCIWGSQLNRLRTGQPSRRVASVLVEIQTVPIVVETIERIQKVHRSLYRTNFTLWAYLERCNVSLGTDADSWLENSSFGGSYYFLEMNGLNVRQGERANTK